MRPPRYNTSLASKDHRAPSVPWPGEAAPAGRPFVGSMACPCFPGPRAWLFRCPREGELQYPSRQIRPSEAAGVEGRRAGSSRGSPGGSGRKSELRAQVSQQIRRLSCTGNIPHPSTRSPGAVCRGGCGVGVGEVSWGSRGSSGLRGLPATHTPGLAVSYADPGRDGPPPAFVQGGLVLDLSTVQFCSRTNWQSSAASLSALGV